jgi:hypothetical protein
MRQTKDPLTAGIYKLTECYFCGGKSANLWQVVNVWKCSSCGLLFKHPQPSEVDLEELYRKAWLEPHERTTETGGTSIWLARIYAGQLVGSLKFDNFSGLRILDFGAGKGAILQALSELGKGLDGRLRSSGAERPTEADSQGFTHISICF